MEKKSNHSVRAEQQPCHDEELSLVMRNQMVHQAPIQESTEFDSKIHVTRVDGNTGETS